MATNKKVKKNLGGFGTMSKAFDLHEKKKKAAKKKSAYIDPTQTFGRPRIYTPELGEKISRAIRATPRGLDFICKNNAELPDSETIRDWLFYNSYPDFSALYARARKAQAEIISDEIVDISYRRKPDAMGRYEQPKLIVDALKWKASKLQPKVYGEKPIDEEDKNKDSLSNLTPEEAALRVSAAFALASDRQKESDKK